MSIIFEIYNLIFYCLYGFFNSFINSTLFNCFKSRKNIEDHVVLITGAARGIGKEIALQFAKFTPKCIILWDKDGSKELEEIVNQIKSLNVQCSYQLCDVTDFNDVYTCAKKVLSEHYCVDILVNNAGCVSGRHLIESNVQHCLNASNDMRASESETEMTAVDNNDQFMIDNSYEGVRGVDKMNTDVVEIDKIDNCFNWVTDIKRTVDVNLMAHFWILKCFLPTMLRKKQGHIVSINSILGLMPVHDAEDYCVSKSGANALAECLNLKLMNVESRIFQTIVYPYMVNTNMFTGVTTRFPYIFPPIDKTYVGEKIVSAVLTNQKTLYIPYTMKLFSILKMSVIFI